MIRWKKKVMFGFGANSCVGPTKPKPKPKKGLLVLVLVRVEKGGKDA